MYWAIIYGICVLGIGLFPGSEGEGQYGREMRKEKEKNVCCKLGRGIGKRGEGTFTRERKAGEGNIC